MEQSTQPTSQPQTQPQPQQAQPLPATRADLVSQNAMIDAMLKESQDAQDAPGVTETQAPVDTKASPPKEPEKAQETQAQAPEPKATAVERASAARRAQRDADARLKQQQQVAQREAQRAAQAEQRAQQLQAQIDELASLRASDPLALLDRLGIDRTSLLHQAVHGELPPEARAQAQQRDLENRMLQRAREEVRVALEQREAQRQMQVAQQELRHIRSSIDPERFELLSKIPDAAEQVVELVRLDHSDRGGKGPPMPYEQAMQMLDDHLLESVVSLKKVAGRLAPVAAAEKVAEQKSQASIVSTQKGSTSDAADRGLSESRSAPIRHSDVAAMVLRDIEEREREAIGMKEPEPRARVAITNAEMQRVPDGNREPQNKEEEAAEIDRIFGRLWAGQKGA